MSPQSPPTPTRTHTELQPMQGGRSCHRNGEAPPWRPAPEPMHICRNLQRQPDPSAAGALGPTSCWPYTSPDPYVETSRSCCIPVGMHESRCSEFQSASEQPQRSSSHMGRLLLERIHWCRSIASTHFTDRQCGYNPNLMAVMALRKLL